MKKCRARKWTDTQLVEAVKKSKSFTDVLRNLNLRTAGGNHASIKYWINQHGLDTSHFKKVFISEAHVANRLSYTKIFCRESLVSRNTVKRALIRLNGIPSQCNECRNEDKWNGKPLVLQLDHKNGTANDNREENLRWLCPNCHSQTSGFAGKSSWRVEKRLISR